MKIEDKIYGEEEINEQVLVELVNCPSVQRLKNISQLGMPDRYYYRKGFSRYEHSLGVLVLLRRLGAGLEEQISGLLHDVSHTAFSHVVDWVLGDPSKEDYQDKIHFNIIKSSEIPGILKTQGISYSKISNPENFGLLERHLPRLCADRVDYALRDLYSEKCPGIARMIFEDLSTKDGQIVFMNKDIANLFAKNYSWLQANHWAGDQARARYYVLSKILKAALNKKIISLNDFAKTEDFVLNLLENSKEEKIELGLNLLKNGFYIVQSKTGIELKKKFRYIDPEILFNGSYSKLSNLSKSYSDFILNEKIKHNSIKKINIFAK